MAGGPGEANDISPRAMALRMMSRSRITSTVASGDYLGCRRACHESGCLGFMRKWFVSPLPAA